MADHELMRVVFGIIANVISIGLFASEVPTFYRAVKKNNSMEDIQPHYYLVMTIGCLFFVLYGLPFFYPKNVLMLTAYGTGFAIHIAYLAIFLLYANRQRMYIASVLLTALLVLGLVFGLVIGLGPTFETRKLSVGPMGIFVGLSLILPRSSVANKVKGRKGVVCMPFLLTALSDTLIGLCWAFYSILGSDNFFVTPNAIGCALGLHQLIRYCVYRSSSTPKSCDDQELSQVEHDRKLGLQLEHDKLKQALAQVELELGQPGPIPDIV